jgi:hypothetical protein
LSAATRLVASSTAPTDSSASAASPRSLKFTRTERPSLEIWFSLPFAKGEVTS